MTAMGEGIWSLHPQLARDSIAIGDLALSRLLLMNDANYPWLILVPRRPSLTEIIDLGADEAQLMAEISQVVRALKAVTSCDKLNVAALGNQVPQLHVHVIARRRSDAAWPKPVWGAVPAIAYQEAERQKLMTALRQRLSLLPT